MWLLKISETDMQRISNNIARLKSASEKIHYLSKIVFNSQRSAFDMLKEVLDYPIITGREIVRNKLLSACYGINNQKIALDSPHEFNRILIEAKNLLDLEIRREIFKLERKKTEK